MFSGIVEEAALVTGVHDEGGNRHLRVKCSFADELKIDQSEIGRASCRERVF